MTALHISSEVNGLLSLRALHTLRHAGHSVNIDLCDLLGGSSIKFAFIFDFLLGLESRFVLTRGLIGEFYESLFTLVPIVECLAVIHVDIARGRTITLI